jgi:hypothetical protein
MNDLNKAMADPEQMVMVARFIDPVEAQMARGALEAAGLECFLQGENANNLLGIAFRVRLLVHRKDEEAARELLPAAESEPDSGSVEDQG